MVSLTYLPQKHFLYISFGRDLKWLKITHFLFGKLQTAVVEDQTCLRNDMNQVTNLKSLGFTRERIANILGVFPEVVLCDIDFGGFFDVAFSPHISSAIRFVVDRLAKLVLFVSVAEADDSPAPTLRISLLSPLPLYLLYWGTVFLILV